MFKKKFAIIALILCIVLMAGYFVVNTGAASTVLLAIQGAITDGNLIKFSGTKGLGEDAGVATETTLTTDSDAKIPTSKAINDFCETTQGYLTTEVDPTVDSDAKIKAILVDEVTKTGDFTPGRMAKINNATGIIEQGTNTDTDVADAVTKKHTQNTDADLDATFEATFVKKVDTVNVLSDITSPGANIEDAVTKKHTSGSETQGGDVSGTVGNASVDKIKRGLDASKSATPAVGDIYLATDTDKLYKCITAEAWTLLKNLDLSGNNVADLADITSAGADIEDAVAKKHTQNTDTDLDADFEATFVKKADTVNVLSDITSPGADIEDAVSKKHTQNTDTAAGGEWDFGAHSAGFTIQTAGGDGTTTIDWTLGNYFKFTHGATDETFTFDPAPTKPSHLTLIIIQDGIGGRDSTWPVSVKWLGAEPTWTDGGAGKGIVMAIVYDGTSYWSQGTPWEE